MVTELHGAAQVDAAVIHPGSARSGDAQIREGRPLTDEDIGVHDRHLDAIHEGRALLVGHLGDEVWDVLGFSEGAPDVYVAVMHSGVTLAPLVGRLVATEILDGVRVEMLEPYRVSRFEG